ncbi:MAG: hypothetical protein KJ648_04155, partial [Candidatus Omnitrophica bacterium]|nr:hypothetical protein [Candidatus Omnitrophota bacterium]
NPKNLVLYIIICLLGLGVVASDVALITKNKALQNSVSEMSELTKEYTSLEATYNNLLKKSISNPGQIQSEEDAKQTKQPTQKEMEEVRTNIRAKTYSTLDNRIAEAKTEYEANIFIDMKQRYNNIFKLSDQYRVTEGEERTKIRNAIAEEWITLGELYSKYTDYQWTSLAEEFGVTDTDTFLQRAEEIQAGFRDKENTDK